jgi:hypothetical protein
MESYFFRQWLRYLAAKTTKTAIFSFAALGLASSLWSIGEYTLPNLVYAQTVNADVALDRRPNETYEALRSRAIAAARTTATENLASDRQATDVTVTVVVRDRGQIVPILSLTENRNTGVNSDPQQGLKYFDQARSLLRFDENDVATNEPKGAPRRSFPNTTPSSSRTPTNSNPGNARGSGEGTFSQPGRLVPPAPGQPTNNTPFGQPDTANPTNAPTNTPNGQTQPGTGLVPQPSPTTPDSAVDTPNQSSPAATPDSAVDTPNQSSPAATPASPGSPTNPSTTTPTSPGTGLTPTAPTTPSGVTPSQPLTPSTSPLP